MLPASNVPRYTVPPPGRSEPIARLFGRDVSSTMPLAFPLQASVIVCVNPPWELIFLCSHPRCLSSFAITISSTSGLTSILHPMQRGTAKRKISPSRLCCSLTMLPAMQNSWSGGTQLSKLYLCPPTLQPNYSPWIKSFYGYLHYKIKRATDSRKELKDIEKLVSSGEEEVATPDPPAAPSPPAAPPPSSWSAQSANCRSLVDSC